MKLGFCLLTYRQVVFVVFFLFFLFWFCWVFSFFIMEQETSKLCPSQSKYQNETKNLVTSWVCSLEESKNQYCQGELDSSPTNQNIIPTAKDTMWGRGAQNTCSFAFLVYKMQLHGLRTCLQLSSSSSAVERLDPTAQQILKVTFSRWNDLSQSHKDNTVFHLRQQKDEKDFLSV